MRRFFILALVLLLVFSFAVNAFAVDIYDEYFQVIDGNTYLGTFATNPLTDLQKDNLRSFLDNELNFILTDYDHNKYYLLSLANESGFSIDYIYDGACLITLNCNASGTVWACANDGILVYHSLAVYNAGDELDGFVIVGGRAFSTCNITFPSPVADYVADYKGSLMLCDDGGLMSDPVNGGSDDDNPEQSGILGFLSDFWEKLKSFFLGLFVPSEGYFKAWYNDVKAVFEEKLSPIFALYEQLSSFFDSVSAAEDTTLFNNPILVSSLSWVKGLITGLVLLLTLIAAYKKIISFIAI